MNAYAFVSHARANNFTAEKVQEHLPALSLPTCAALLTGVAYIYKINSDGSVVVDDGQP